MHRLSKKKYKEAAAYRVGSQDRSLEKSVCEPKEVEPGGYMIPRESGGGRGACLWISQSTSFSMDCFSLHISGVCPFHVTPQPSHSLGLTLMQLSRDLMKNSVLFFIGG